MPASVVHSCILHQMLAFKHAKLSPFVLMQKFCHAAPCVYPTELTVDCSHMITCDQQLFASSPANTYRLYSPHSILGPQIFKSRFSQIHLPREER